MMWTKLFLPQPKALFTIFVATISLISPCAPLLAQSNRPVDSSSKKVQVRFIPERPPDPGTPPAPDGTGSRGGCPYKKELPPMTNLGGSENLELTVDEHPTFWIYVPHTQKEVMSGEFSLQEGDNEVYSTHFQLPATPGIVSITLPSTVKPLEVGKKYNWYFEINCSPPNLSEPPDSVRGQVQRVPRSQEFESEFKAAKTPLERVAVYGKHHIWYEMITELAQLRLKQPQDPTLMQSWVQLLSDRNVGLAAIAQQPIVGTVKPNSQPE